MWKLLVLLFLGASVAQDITLTCNFGIYFDEYFCTLPGIEVLDPEANVIITGNHLENMTNDDVEVVRIVASNTPFIINQLFTAFPNLLELNIDNSHLLELRIPETANLEWLILDSNNITKIDSDSLRGQTRLEYFRAFNNHIDEIAEDAFEGLQSLTYVGFINNQIHDLAPRTFHPLVSISVLDFERNNLTSIGDDLFINNKNLTLLYLEFNQIDAISPTFVSNHALTRLSFVDLRGNVCAQRVFTVGDQYSRMIMTAGLNVCFNHFDGQRETRRFVIESSGPFILYDNFGNMIARVDN